MNTDRNGFPVEHCNRCGGDGHLTGYRHVHGGVCFGCGGTGWVHPAGTVAKLAAEWRNYWNAARTANTAAYWNPDTRDTVCGVKPGDELKCADGQWRTLAEVKVGREMVGESWVGGRLTGVTLRVRLTYTDGTSHNGGYLMTRRPNVDAAREVRAGLVERALLAFERTVARRARKARVAADR